MFSVREVPWHGLGKVLQAPPTVAEAIVAAGLDWTVAKEQLKTADGVETDGFAVRRSVDGNVLGVVGPKYSPLQNAEAFAFFQPFLDSGEVTLETAGSLRGGKRVFVLASLKRDPSQIVPGDEVKKYLMLSNSHDGSLAVRVGFTPIRIVCANTLAMAHEAKASQLVRVLHRGNVKSTLESVRETVNAANASFEATAEQYRRLASMPCVTATLERYVKIVFSQGVGSSSQRAPNVLPQITRLFETGKGNQLPGARGTMWAAYNAVTEYLSYERGADRDRRMDSVWFGSGAQLNTKALQAALLAPVAA